MAQLAESRNIEKLVRTSQQKAISTGILTFTLVVVLLFGSLRPTIGTITNATKKLRERKAAYEMLQTHNANLTELKTQQRTQSVKEKLQALDYYFPSDGDFSLFVVNLSEIARTHHLVVESVSFSDRYNNQIAEVEELQFEEMRPVTFTVSLQGDPGDLARFISYMENTPFLPKILGVGYSPGQIIKDKTAISVTMLLYQMNSSAASYE